ncbi:MAG: MBL fold metallo-hydrolase [Porphyrobacter sp.]|jgi:alkyl sulfatase BDS1-like metallo-beta-lactamase superfamily hydrolase|nr:MBL fold metallo-hydrolase [Porphyrobacter sp.]
MRRALGLGFAAVAALASGGLMPLAAQDPASEFTAAANAALATRLSLAGGEDEAEAGRGKITEIPDGLITKPDGAVVWDWRPYAFLDAAEPPASVNPSLWRQARLNRIHGLFEVVPGAVWQVRGYDISVMTIVRGKTGYIIIDPLTAEETAAASWKLAMAHLPKLPIRAVIFTHSHSDHFGGVGGIISRDTAVRDGIRIIAPHGFSEEAVAENVLAGTAMGRRATYMFGTFLAPGPQGQVDTGLGPRLPAGTIGYMEPTETIPQTGGEVMIDGISFDFMDAGGTEAPSEFMFYIADYKALHTAEVATRVLHNVLTLRGAQVRDPLNWSKVIDRALQKWGGTAELALASHGWPLWGKARVETYLAGQRDAYRYVHDRTLNRANNGATLHEVADGIAEAPVQQTAFDTRGYYGTLNHNMKATYQRYFGWWDGVPANFNPLPPTEAAKRYVKLAGGPDKLLAAGREALKAGDYRWAAEVLNHLVFAEPANTAARGALASAYDQLGYQAESGAWRNYYLAGAASLRGTATSTAVSSAQSRAYIEGIPTEALFDALATRFDADKGRGISGQFQFILPDRGEQVAIDVGGGVEFPRYDSRFAAPTATITIDRAALDDVTLGAATFPQLVQSGRVKIEGNIPAFAQWFALHPPYDPRFAVVEP